MSVPSTSSPAEELVGRRLGDRWTVQSRFRAGPGATGGNFSVNYLAEDDSGRQVFVKALDFSAAFQSEDSTRVLQRMTEAFNFERDLLRQCGERRLRRIIRILADGTVEGTTPPVPYLVFEHADQGDVRSFLASMQQVDVAFVFRSLHHVAVGLKQLHSIGVAHQDLKPSNVVVFETDGSKIADLGRSSTKDREALHDHLTVAGDRTYCPPEQMYGYASLNWDRRRQATDLYHLGSMLHFMFTGLSTTTALVSKLDPAHGPHGWDGPHQDALPYLLAAFDEILSDFRAVLPNDVEDEVCRLLRYLCHPDLDTRGHPTDRAGIGSNYNLERFVSAFNRLAYRAERGLVAWPT